MAAELDALRRLARLRGVLPVYRDGFKRFREASPETLVALLRELGEDLDGPARAAEALRRGRSERWSAFAPATVVAWDEAGVEVPLRLPASEFRGPLRWELALEGSAGPTGEADAQTLSERRRVRIGGAEFAERRLVLPGPTPLGRHRLKVELGCRCASVHVVSAPSRCHTPPAEPLWGVFLPLYALRTARDWGAGDFADLGALLDWTRAAGGRIVGTLPLLAAFLDEPFEYSPYVPASRLFWNEFYLDLGSPPATAAALRQSPLVEYREVAALKRRALEARLDATPPAELEAYAEALPELRDYAAFRALTEERGPWTGWPEPARGGRIEPGGYDPRRFRYHVLAQRLADEQLAGLAARAGEPGLYLDLPLGVHPAGFDVWRSPRSFAAGAAGGAPPDRFFTKGQDWSFSPLHPRRMLDDGLDYWFRCLRHHLKHAGVLRLDHFMGLHRLYWIPRGAAADQGTYVQYPAEAMYAAVCLESARNRAWIVGEDLGTVPHYVRQRMRRHAIDGMYVAQFSVCDDPAQALRPAPAESVATVNTHDTPTFAAFWNGADIDDQLAMGLIGEAEAEAARQGRARARAALAAWLGTPENRGSVLAAILIEMGRSPARAVLATLEDLWGEEAPQNTPGTGRERPNWRRKARLSLEGMRASTEVAEALGRLDAARRENAPTGERRRDR